MVCSNVEDHEADRSSVVGIDDASTDVQKVLYGESTAGRDTQVRAWRASDAQIGRYDRFTLRRQNDLLCTRFFTLPFRQNVYSAPTRNDLRSNLPADIVASGVG